jgi:hypothetical protein
LEPGEFSGGLGGAAGRGSASPPRAASPRRAPSFVAASAAAAADALVSRAEVSQTIRDISDDVERLKVRKTPRSWAGFSL